MVDISSIFTEISKAISIIFGLDTNESTSVLYGIIIIFFISWLTLAGYLLSKKPTLLEKWKYPTFYSITILFLISISSYVIAYLFVYFTFFLTAFDSKELTQPPFIITIMFMIMYIILFLNRLRKPRNITDTETIPRELIYFIPKSFEYAFALLLINLNLYFLHDVLKTGIVQSISNISQTRKWISFGMLFFITLLVVYSIFKPSKAKTKIGNFIKKIRIYPKTSFFIITLILVLVWLSEKYL